MKKILSVILSLLAASQLAFALPVFAATPPAGNTNDPNALLGQTGLGGSNPDGSTTSLPLLIGGYIRIALSFLGIIFLVLILYAGFNWMTAGGDSDKVDTAKSTLSRAVIGIIIILSAYAITSFVINRVQCAAVTNGPPGLGC